MASRTGIREPSSENGFARLFEKSDWAATPLGPASKWAPELTSAAAFVLDNPFPTALVAREGLVTIYNDAFGAILGNKNSSVGQSFADIWSEAWSEIGPIADRALAGEPTFIEHFPLIIERKEQPEQAYFTFSYSPVRDARGDVIGFIDTILETTEAVVSGRQARENERRQAFLLALSDAVAALADPVDIQAAASRLLGEHLGVQRAGYGEVEGNDVVVHADFTDDVPSMAGRYPIEAFGPALAAAYRHGGSVILRDAETDPHLDPSDRDQYRKLQVAAHVTVAIRKIGQPVISLGVQSHVPRDWTDAEIRLIGEVAERTWTAVARARAEAHQATLLAELQHRVRNVLAMIRSVVRRTSTTKKDVNEFVQHLEGRIEAMARTQALLTRSPGKGIDLEDLLRDEMLAQAADSRRVQFMGPSVSLPAKAAEVLTLAVHELATNSVKYGVLGQADGRVAVSWSCSDALASRKVRLTWREVGVALDGEGERSDGFGTELITKRVPYELNGEGSLDFEDGALTATIEFPVEKEYSVLETDPLVG